MNANANLPAGLRTHRRLDQWLRFGPERSVTITSGKVEIGQGIITALAQIAAEELDVALARIRVVSGDTSLTPNEGQTSSSRSVNEGGTSLKLACAEARNVLLQEAARRLGVTPEKLIVEDGVIRSANQAVTSAVLSYWELPHATLLARETTGSIPPKRAELYSIVGSGVRRLDLPPKALGQPSFVHDVHVPGMLFGRVVRPPSMDAQLISLDAAAVQCLPGVVAVVQDGSFVGVVAEREEQAVKARLVAARVARWKERALPSDSETVHDYLSSRSTQDETILERRLGPSRIEGRLFESVYTRPYLAHASIGPSCALARIESGRIDVWTHSQGVFPLQEELALVLGVPAGNIVVHHVEGAGCYGHNGADDAALDAALLSRAVEGRPVQVQWMRDDEFMWEPYGPATVMKVGAQLDASGNIADWTFDVWSNGHMHRPGSAKSAGKVSSLLAAWTLQEPIPRAPQTDAAQPGVPGSGCIARNAVSLYDIPNQRIMSHRVEDLPLRVSTIRSTGAFGNVFAIESFMDELAAVAGADPVEYRIRHLRDPRAREVIELAAQKFGWHAHLKGDGTVGQGIGFAQHRNRYAYFAIAVEIGLDPDLHVKRAVAAVDVGQAINPDGVMNQMEGGIVQAISWTLKEQVLFDRQRILSRTWEEYPILTFPEVPHVEVHVIQRPGSEPLGAGEAPMGPTAAAVANAVYHAAGTRIRDLPITRERIVASA